jgi:hypothetical protein
MVIFIVCRFTRGTAATMPVQTPYLKPKKTGHDQYDAG